MSYHLAGNAPSTTAVGLKPTASSFVANVQRFRGNIAALKKLLADLVSRKISTLTALAKSPTSSSLRTQLADLDAAIANCRIEISKATPTVAHAPVFVQSGAKAVVESNTISVAPSGQIVPGPGAQIVVTPEVAPSSGAEAADVVVSSGSIGTVIFVGGLIGLAYLMLRKRGVA